MLIYLTILMYHLVVTYKTLSLYAKEKPIFKEYRLNKGLVYCVLLLPLGMLILLIGPFLNQIPMEASHALALLCFLPSFMAAKHLGNRLETTGTNRVKKPTRRQLSVFFGHHDRHGTRTKKSHSS